MYVNPPPQQAYITPEDRAQWRQYGLGILIQAFGNSKFASKLSTVVEKAEEEAFSKCGGDQALYVKFFQKKIETSKEGIMKIQIQQQQMHQQRLAAQGAGAAQHAQHQHPQQAQLPQAGMQHALPQQQQQPHPQVRPPQLEAESGMATSEQPVVEQQVDDFNDFLGTFVTPHQQQQLAQQQMVQQQMAQQQMTQSLYAQQQKQQQQQQAAVYAQQNVAAAAQQQQPGPAVGRQQQPVATAAGTAAATQQQMHMTNKMAGMPGNHAGQMGAMQAGGYPQAMSAAAQMGVSMAARAASGQAAFPQPAHGGPGVAPVPPGAMGASGGMAVEQAVAGMYGGGVTVQPAAAAQHGPGGGMMGMPNQQGPGMMGQLAQQQHQQHTGVGMSVAGGNVGAGPMGMIQAQQQQQAQPHPHAHNGTAAPTVAPQMPYGMPQAQQQDMSYGHLSQQQHQLLAHHQAVVAAAAQQAQAVQQQQHQQHAQQQQQVAAAAAVQQQQQQQQLQQQQAAQMLARVASGGLPPQATGAAAVAAAAAASRNQTPVIPMGPATAAAHLNRAQTVAGPGINGGPALAAQQPQQVPQLQQAPLGAGMQAMGAGAAYGGISAAAGLASQPVAIPAAAPLQVVAPAGMPTGPTLATSTVPVAVPAASTAVPTVPVAAAAVTGGTHVIVHPDATPAMVEEYWRVITELKTRVSMLRMHLEKYTKLAEHHGSESKATKSKRILVEAYNRCTADPNSPEYSSLPVSAASLRLMSAVLASLDSNAQAGARRPAPPGAALGAGAADGAAGMQSAAGALHDGSAAVRPMATTPPLQQPQAQSHPAVAAAAVPVKLEGGGMAAPTGAVLAGTNASRAAVVAAAAQNAKLRGVVKSNLQRPMQFKAPGEAAAGQGKPPMDGKLERTADVTRLLGLLAQPLPHATLRVHASRGAADVLNFDWDSLMPSLPAHACTQLTTAAAAAAATAAAAGPPRARTVSVCRVSGMSYSEGGGAAAAAHGPTAGASSVQAPSAANGEGPFSGADDGGGGGAADAGLCSSSELKRRREAVEATCLEVQEELGATVALRLLDGEDGEAVVSSGGLEADAWTLECEAAVAPERAGEDESRGPIAAGAAGAGGGTDGPPWKRLRVCVPWDYPEASPIPTFASTGAAHTHPYGRAARLHFQTALQSGHVPPHLSIRLVAKAWRDAVARVCGAVRAADAAAAHTTATPAAAM